MIFAVLPLLAALLWGLRLRRAEAADACLSRSDTDGVKGFFILWVVASHVSQQIGLPKDCVYNDLWTRFSWWYQQIIVAMFMFYSGWGVGLSFLKKGQDYVRTMPLRRVLRTCVVFWLIVPIYVLLFWLQGTKTTFSWIAQFSLAWSSYWYIFAIVMLYAITWLVLRLLRHERVGMQFAAVTLGVVVYMMVISRTRKGFYCYDTVPCYVLGLWAAACRERVVGFLRGHRSTLACWLAIFAALFALVFAWRSIKDLAPLVLVVRNLLFVAAVVLLTALVRFGNPLLEWFGRNLVYVYLGHGVAIQLVKLQRQLVARTGWWTESYIADVCFVFLFAAAFVLLYRWVCETVWPSVRTGAGQLKSSGKGV